MPKREQIAPKCPHPPPQSKTNTTRSAELLSKLTAGSSTGSIPWGCKSLGLEFPGKKNVLLLLNVNEFELLIPSEFENLGKMHPCTLRCTPDTVNSDRTEPLMEANAADGARLVLMNFLLGKRRGRRGFQECKIVPTVSGMEGAPSLCRRNFLLYIFLAYRVERNIKEKQEWPIWSEPICFPGCSACLLFGTKTNPEIADTFSTKVWVTDWQ